MGTGNTRCETGRVFQTEGIACVQDLEALRVPSEAVTGQKGLLRRGQRNGTQWPAYIQGLGNIAVRTTFLQVSPDKPFSHRSAFTMAQWMGPVWSGSLAELLPELAGRGVL